MPMRETQNSNEICLDSNKVHRALDKDEGTEFYSKVQRARKSSSFPVKFREDRVWVMTVRPSALIAAWNNDWVQEIMFFHQIWFNTLSSKCHRTHYTTEFNTEYWVINQSVAMSVWTHGDKDYILQYRGDEARMFISVLNICLKNSVPQRAKELQPQTAKNT